MVTITLYGSHGQSESLVRNGHAQSGKHLFRCRACRRQSREHPTPNHSPQARRQEILSAYQERSSLRGLTRTFGVSRTTVSRWIKKVAQLPPFSTTLVDLGPDAASSLVLELDERWSFVSKKRELWVWIAWCRQRGKWSPMP